MTAASRPQVVRLRSGDLARIRQVRPDDVPALARAYAKLSEESRYLRGPTVVLTAQPGTESLCWRIFAPRSARVVS